MFLEQLAVIGRLPDEVGEMRRARKVGAVVQEELDGAAGLAHGREALGEKFRRHHADHDAGEIVVVVDDAAAEADVPAVVEAAEEGLRDFQAERRIVALRREIVAVGQVERLHIGRIGVVDEPPVAVEDDDRRQLRRARQPAAQQGVDGVAVGPLEIGAQPEKIGDPRQDQVDRLDAAAGLLLERVRDRRVGAHHAVDFVGVALPGVQAEGGAGAEEEQGDEARQCTDDIAAGGALPARPAL